jgi:hypothetical protein
MTGTGLILGEPSSYLLFTIFFSLLTFYFSLPLSFFLLFPLEESIDEYYHHTEEETEDYEPCTTVFNPRITKHCDLRGEGVEKGVACDLAERILSGVFCLSEMGVEGAGGGGVIGERGCSGGVWSGSDGAGDTRQQARHGEGACCRRRWRWVRCKRGHGWR